MIKMIAFSLRSFRFPLVCLVGALSSFPTLAQIPTQCLEIESILVDACNPSAQCGGGTEGQNEMVRFITGPQSTALTDLQATWPNNTWRGLVQNATTASLTSQLNSTIQSCGRLLEPPGGVIPPGSTVLLVTSTDMCLAGNSFAALSDTIYIVFQNAGNTLGHFANSPAAGQAISATPPAGSNLRTLIMRYLPTGCSDTASYVRELLVNNQGTYGGQAGESDGGTALFSWPGVPQVTYVNYGCQAPFAPLVVEGMADGTLCGGVGTVNLTGTVSGGAFNSIQWTGGSGTIADPSSLNTTYTAGPGDVGNVVLQLCAVTDCATPTCTEVIIPAGTGPTITITPNGPTALCAGQNVTLTASGANSYVWSTGATTASITTSTPSIYTVTGTNACGTGSAEIEVTNSTGVNVTVSGNTTICAGGSTILTANGADSYVWSTTETTQSITITIAGTYAVTGTSSCGTAQTFVTVTEAAGGMVTILGDPFFCAGQNTTLTAQGADSYAWSTSETTNSITVSSAGMYSVVGNSACGLDSASVEVTLSAGPTVSITGNTTLCAGSTTQLTASGADSYVWSTSELGATIAVEAAGTYTVVGTDACGSDSTSVEVTLEPLPTISVSGNALICPGEATVLTSVSSSPITWSNGASGSTISVSQPGLYVATATNACGVSSSGITVQSVAISSSFQPVPASGTAPLTVNFDNNSTPSSATYSWTFGDGTSGTTAEPTHLYTTPGNYTVILIVNANGCTVSSDQVVIVTSIPVVVGESSIVVPNVITPNGDRLNDILTLITENIISVDMQIFNRWGQKMSELNRVGESWDARSMSGETVSEGTYFYVLKAVGGDGKQYDLSGHLTVLR